MIQRVLGLIQYNKDWFKYLLGRWVHPAGDGLMSFRLRNGQTVKVRPDTRFILNEIYLERAYDIPGVDFRSCGNILDLGANMGLFALYVASKAPRTVVHCFEPGTNNLLVLQDNIRSNRVRAEIYPMAVTTYCGVGHLRLDRGSYAYALGESGAPGEDVQCVDLAQVFKLTGSERFDFVKMDIEGAEAAILAGSADDQLRRIKALALEWHHSMQKMDELAHRLKGIGFEVGVHEVAGHPFLKARLRNGSSS